MYLKALTLKGFKSFADPATLEFEPGVSVIVGPNGSGKSNVVDAIGWVLGAQAPSAVRSQKMDDVIFAGTQSRAALGRAEVSLTLDNTSGVLPLDFSEVVISRTLFRTGESDYSLNGVPCRLLDIQELLSDAGVGRHQHVIVSQGQIDAVLNARPEDRRLIIEEAAGVLKYRRRKDKAARRMAAAEANLTRLQDLLREVRRQLRPLERQADAARRYGEVVGELTALRVFLSGREIDGLRTRVAANAARRAELASAERELKRTVAELDDRVRASENELSSLGGHELGDELATFESLNERARGQLALLSERRRGVEREREAFVDQQVVATLESDALESRHELAGILARLGTLDPEGAVLAVDEQSFEADRAVFDAELSAGGSQPQLPLGGRGSGEATRSATSQSVGEPADESHDDDRTALVDALQRSRDEREHAEHGLEAAQAEHRAAEADEQTWRARAEALALALDEARARAGADRLAPIDGVLGTLLDLVRVDEGWEAAFEAAVGEAIRSVVVRDTAAARRALHALDEGEVGGAVLALGIPRRARSTPSVGDPIRPHVHADRPDVGQLLDQLLGGATAVASWTEAMEAAVAHPDAVIVTRDGGRFGPDGWRIGGGGVRVTAAALDEARARSREATEVARQATSTLASARARVEMARRREVEASRHLGRAFDEARAGLEARARGLAARRSQLDLTRASLTERREALERRLAELERRLDQHADQRDEAERRFAGLDERSTALDRLHAFVEARLGEIQQRLSDLREQRRQQSEATRAIAVRLDAERHDRVVAEREVTETRDKAQRAEIDVTELRMKLEAAVEALRRDLDIEPDAAIAAESPALPEGITAPARARELERELRIMGPVNPLALQEFEALQERHAFLQEQLDDVKATRRELNKVVHEIDREIVNVFAAAFADVAANFQQLFETLFPGGRGRLQLTDPENLLETGIEVEARPSGKNVKKLSLLSGGERSLTALAYLFAVFRSRPSPFYVMDEVEAALDDINLHRFLELLQEFRQDAQLVVVSHQKRTMDAADCLYGVSMQSGGSSKVVSERLATQPV